METGDRLVDAVIRGRAGSTVNRGRAPLRPRFVARHGDNRGCSRTQRVAGAAVGAREEAARALWNDHYGQLAGWCAALVGDRDAAHDIASEAFTRLLCRWVTVHDPKGYLYVTATNLVRDRWRREQRDRSCRPGSRRPPPVHTGGRPWLRDLVERLPDRLRLPSCCTTTPT